MFIFSNEKSKGPELKSNKSVPEIVTVVPIELLNIISISLVLSVTIKLRGMIPISLLTVPHWSGLDVAIFPVLSIR